VSVVRDGTAAETTAADVGGHPVRVPMVDIETVGAGGGSVAWVDEGGALRVGPLSAGADPGPACYGRGGTRPTVTDAALVLGYLGNGLELGGQITLDGDRAEAVLSELAGEAGLDRVTDAARGVYRVANATMARAIRSVTIERGLDPRQLALVAFGGAGPIHAAALADRLGIGRVRVPRANGVLSALGLLAADERHDAVRTHRVQLDEADTAAVEERFADLAATVEADASDPAAATLHREADLRYAGQSHELTVAVPDPFDPAVVRDRFDNTHDGIRGYRMPGEPVELVNLRMTATIPSSPPSISYKGYLSDEAEWRQAYFDGEWIETRVVQRASLEAGETVDGPVIVEGGESTIVVRPGWQASVDARGTLTLEAEK
jgi:N-methylhydantoinase A